MAKRATAQALEVNGLLPIHVGAVFKGTHRKTGEVHYFAIVDNDPEQRDVPIYAKDDFKEKAIILQCLTNRNLADGETNHASENFFHKGQLADEFGGNFEELIWAEGSGRSFARYNYEFCPDLTPETIPTGG